ncbi:SRPBCC domain-containing protein [Terriglobus sp. TAA 43]|uniref:SRPBCC domain-containing protein n=1 Tax=Terriglobus sp. TAA 43 TaxID=278961 RepID=UPI00068EE3C6|nr:SRPBCC domain-containing protein [Terriglobus sp. TAA 43]
MNKGAITLGTFTIERHYPHLPEKVFDAFRDPVKKRRWMGGEDDPNSAARKHHGQDFEIVSFEMNFKEDEFERWTFRVPGGELMRNDTRYHRIIPNHSIVFVYTMDCGDHRMSSSQNTVEFIREGQGTKLVFTEQGVYFDDPEAGRGREIGTNDVLSKLGEELDRNG